MSKASPITKVSGSAALVPPEFMVNEPLVGLEGMREYVVPPRIQLIQKSSDDDKLRRFSPGDVVAFPAGVTLNPMGDGGSNPGFIFVPVFFFVEFCEWNPISLRGQVPAVRTRTFDPASELAARCKDPNRWEMPHPDKPGLTVRNVEHLNFLVKILKPGGLGELMLLSFAKSEHFAGRTLCSLIKMRKAPPFGCVFLAKTTQKQNAQGSWFGIDVSNPGPDDWPSGWVDKKIYEELNELFIESEKVYKNALIRPDYGDQTDTDPVVSTPKGAEPL